MSKGLFAGVAVLLITAGWVHGSMTEVLPTSYTFDRDTDAGTYTYHDETGEQLIDGQYGTTPWWTDLGNGPAYEWVGWSVNDPIVNIDFDFGSPTCITEVHVGSVQNNANDVVLPDVDLYTSDDLVDFDHIGSIVVPESSDNDDTYKTYVFGDLDINSRYVRVTASHNLDGNWTYLDEVDFYIPEPASASLLLLGGLALLRRKRGCGAKKSRSSNLEGNKK